MSTSFDSRLGQLFVVELKSARWSPRLERLLRAVQPTGVLVPLNRLPSEDSLREIAKRISLVHRSTPLIGIADPTISAVSSLVPVYSRGPSWVSKDDLERHAEILGKITGSAKYKLGLNVDFSLWLDLAHPGRGMQSPDQDPRLIAKCGRAYLRGLSSTEVLACARDFPGIESVELDRKFGLLSSKPMADLWREDLLPFRELLPQLPLVMISQAAYKAYDFETPRPAVWSSEIVTGLLRAKLGYKGVAVAHIPKVFALMHGTTIGEAVVKAMEAGCDLFILPADESSVGSTMSAVRSALESGRISRGHLGDSIRRVDALKRKLAKPSPVVSEWTLRRIKREMQAGEKQ